MNDGVIETPNPSVGISGRRRASARSLAIIIIMRRCRPCLCCVFLFRLFPYLPTVLAAPVPYPVRLPPVAIEYWTCPTMYCAAGTLYQSNVNLPYPNTTYPGCTTVNIPAFSIDNNPATQWGSYCNGPNHYDICHAKPVIPNMYTQSLYGNGFDMTYGNQGLYLLGTNTSNANGSYVYAWDSTPLSLPEPGVQVAGTTFLENLTFPVWNTVPALCWRVVYTHGFVMPEQYLSAFYCAPGYYPTNATVCAGCPNGTYNNGTNGIACYPCGPNQTSPALSTSASACVKTNAPPGYYFNLITLASMPCGVGVFSVGGYVTACTACSPGAKRAGLGYVCMYACMHVSICARPRVARPKSTPPYARYYRLHGTVARGTAPPTHRMGAARTERELQLSVREQRNVQCTRKRLLDYAQYVCKRDLHGNVS